MDQSIDPRERERKLAARIETRHRQPDLCTIYEPGPEGESNASQWLTAKGDAFVDAETIR